MRLQRENETLVFDLNPPERLLLVHALRELIENYRLKPHELDAPTIAAWYSSHGRGTVGMSDEEVKEWLENLHSLKKGSSLQRLEEWSAQLNAGTEEAPKLPTLRVPLDHAASFVAVINDYRLAAAARHDIGQAEMDAHSPWQLARLPPPRQKAVLEIHFLAWIIEETLRVAGQ